MKKFLALLIMFSVCIAPVVGCGGAEKKDEKKEEKKEDKKDADKKDADKKDAEAPK